MQADSGKSRQRTSKNKSPQPKDKINPRSDHSRADIAWMIYKFFKVRGDNEAILDFGDLSNVQLKNEKVQAFDAQWDEVLSPVTERLTDNMLESLYRMQIETSEEFK